MISQTPTVNVSGDYEENVLRWAKHLGSDKTRRAVFDLIYGRGSRPLSRKQIAERLGKGEQAQLVQNALEQLARHHLIARIENEGQVRDGSRWLYRKEPSVQANRDLVRRYADDPGAARKVTTKRRPTMQIPFSLVTKRASPAGQRRRVTARAARTSRLRIAVLVTNPDSRSSLQSGIEFRYIQEGVQRADRDNQIEVRPVLAPTLDTLIDILNTYRPDVVHFSGHGGEGTLLFDNERAGEDGGTILDFDMVARVIEATSARPRLLVLAACDTVVGVERFLTTVPAVIAMADSIDDVAACEFSRRFYQSLATAGTAIGQCIAQAKLVLENRGYADATLPTLIVRDEAITQQSLLRERGSPG